MTRLDRSSKLAVCLFAVSITAAVQEKKEPTATELSRNETPAKAILRTFENQEYEFRSAAEAMPATKWDYRPAAGMFKNEKPEFGPSEVRSFAVWTHTEGNDDRPGSGSQQYVAFADGADAGTDDLELDLIA